VVTPDRGCRVRGDPINHFLEKASWQAKEQHLTEIQIEFDVPAKMRDGTVLRADVYRPGDSGPWPVLLSRLPYGKQMPLTGAAPSLCASPRCVPIW